MTTARHRRNLPQLKGQVLLTDGGLETTLVFHEGIDLPFFAAFDLLRSAQGRRTLADYYARYAQIAIDRGLGFVLDTPTWRASADWGDKLGYSAAALAAVNREAIELMFEIRDRFEKPGLPFVVSGNIGPRGDGYTPSATITPAEAAAYHRPQIAALADAGADMITVLTMTHAGEAAGIAQAARSLDIPVVISFTLETDGNLPSGQSLEDAIAEVDRETDSAPVYFMINCAHPDHFFDAVARGEGWTRRIRGLRANASRLSHAELDEAEELDDGNPDELGRQYGDLLRVLPQLVVLGGCCGTDHRHVEAIGHSCVHAHAA